MKHWYAAGLLLLVNGPLLAADYKASLDWFRRVELGTLVSGVISEVAARPGERVDSGTVLLRLDPRGYNARLSQAKSHLERARQLRDEAQRELERAQELYDRTLLSQHDLDVAQIAYASARADFRAARAAVTQASLELEYSVIRAPFDAVVLGRKAEIGQTIITRLQSDPLFTVAEAGRMVARVVVPEGEISRVRPGQTAEVRLASGARYQGEVYAVGLEPLSGQNGYSVEVVFEARKDEQLRAGQPAEVTLP